MVLNNHLYVYRTVASLNTLCKQSQTEHKLVWNIFTSKEALLLAGIDWLRTMKQLYILTVFKDQQDVHNYHN